MMHRRKAMSRREGPNLDASWMRDSSEIISDEVDNHDVLSHFLWVGF